MDLTEKLVEIARAAVGAILVRSVDRLALYPATVNACASDGSTVDVTPLDPRVQGHQGVPLRVGVAGSVAVVKPGAVVLLGWEGGDPSKVYALPSWYAGAGVSSLKLTADAIVLNGGTNHVARVGDATSGHTHTVVFALTAGPYPVAGTITIQTATDTIAENHGTVKSG